MRKFAVAAIVLAAFCLCGLTQGGEKWKLGIVAKVGGVPWANAIEEGVKQDSEELGVQWSFIGPTGNDPANQVRAVEDLIAQGVNVIGVVPNDMDVLEPVFKRAMDAGIKIITHEGPGQPSKDWDFEMVANDAMGIANLELMAKHMNYEGEYVVYVGSLTVPMHNI